MTTPSRPSTLDPIEDATRRQFITGVGAAALAAAFLAACGDDDAEGQSAATSSITSKYGTYDIPVNPERLLLMGNRYDLETALALGMSPIAVGREYAFSGGAADYVAPWVPFEGRDDIEVFDAGAGTLEQMLALDPDLIFCQGYQLDNTERYRGFGNLSKVAPILPTNILPWREDLEQIAEWLGREDKLAATFAEYDKQRDALKRAHAQRLSKAKIAIGYPTSDSEFWVVNPGDPTSPAANMLEELGGSTVSLPEDPQSPGWSLISFENLRMLDQADALLVYATDDATRQLLVGNALWPLLNVVKNKRLIISPNNLGTGSVYTRMECMRLFNEVYATLA